MAAHKNIRIQFEIEGRRYEAVGFLNEEEESVNGNEMFARTANENGGAIVGEDYEDISKHRNELPTELRGYYLDTKQRRFDFPRDSFQYFNWHDRDGWYEGSCILGLELFDNCLVLRRCR